MEEERDRRVTPSNDLGSGNFERKSHSFKVNIPILNVLSTLLFSINVVYSSE